MFWTVPDAVAFAKAPLVARGACELATLLSLMSNVVFGALLAEIDLQGGAPFGIWFSKGYGL